MRAMSFLMLLALLLPATAYGHIGTANCFSYLKVEKTFTKETGSRPGGYHLVADELVALPDQGLLGPWGEWVSAQSAHNRALKDLRRKFGDTSKFRANLKAASGALDRWLENEGVHPNVRILLTGFVSAHMRENEVLGTYTPDIVFRVAAHERVTRCPA